MYSDCALIEPWIESVLRLMRVGRILVRDSYTSKDSLPHHHPSIASIPTPRIERLSDVQIIQGTFRSLQSFPADWILIHSIVFTMLRKYCFSLFNNEQFLQCSSRLGRTLN